MSHFCISSAVHKVQCNRKQTGWVHGEGSCLKTLTRGVNLFTGELRKMNKMAVLGIVFLGGG